ncbi:MAG: hypothetical protein K2O29_05010 [Ruminococcus sp.]|nr:hypothetical protein [Ruminococcus sp.]MDE7137801.1 hypothetical protein [Ruminococcus sp.]
MKISKNKTMFTRIVTAMISTLMLVVVFSFSAVSVMAMAADNAQEIVTVSELPTAEESFEVTPLDSPENTSVEPVAVLNNQPDVVMLAGDGSGSDAADSAYQKVINFFITWIRRIGAMVALVGAVMFGLAIKNNDADQKQAGLLTMVAGFVVFAICLAVDMFDLFS